MGIKVESLPLWRQLSVTAEVVLAVRGGVSGTAAVERVSAEVRPGVQALAFHVWRNLGRAEALRKLLAQKAPPPAVDALLCVALALAWQDGAGPYDMFTLVNQAVEAAKRSNAMKPQANFVNACLRRFLRERAALVNQTNTNLSAVWNHPLWWIKRLQSEYPHDWGAILNAANARAPMALRVNLRRTSLSAYMATLAQAGIPATADAQGAVVLQSAIAVQHIPGFDAGLVSVQDAAAQLAAPLLLQGLCLRPGARVLDACAAPGGKTGHLLEISDAEVTALDVAPERVARIGQNLTRLGLRARVLTADALQPQTWWDGQSFDAILLDAPCTASGIVRRHPDIRWLRRDSDVAQLARLQAQMLQTLWPLLAVGGQLLYCTCSVFKAEGEQQVQTFLVHHSDAGLLPSPGHLLPINGSKKGGFQDNVPCESDGFYYALLQKQMA